MEPFRTQVKASVSNRGGRFRFGTGPGGRSTTRLSSIVDVVRTFERGGLRSYNDLVALSR